jgi:hypothetical protein
MIYLLTYFASQINTYLFTLNLIHLNTSLHIISFVNITFEYAMFPASDSTWAYLISGYIRFLRHTSNMDIAMVIHSHAYHFLQLTNYLCQKSKILYGIQKSFLFIISFVNITFEYAMLPASDSTWAYLISGYTRFLRHTPNMDWNVTRKTDLQTLIAITKNVYIYLSVIRPAENP